MRERGVSAQVGHIAPGENFERRPGHACDDAIDARVRKEMRARRFPWDAAGRAIDDIEDSAVRYHGDRGSFMQARDVLEKREYALPAGQVRLAKWRSVAAGMKRVRTA